MKITLNLSPEYAALLVETIRLRRERNVLTGPDLAGMPDTTVAFRREVRDRYAALSALLTTVQAAIARAG